MRPLHIFFAILVTAVWGSNFIFIQYCLNDMPPLLLGTVRFILVSIPAVFLLKRPAIPFKLILMYGFFTFALQFSFLFAGMAAGMPPGLTSLIAQVQVFFSLFFAGLFLNEKPTSWQVLGALVAFTGIGLVSMKLGGDTTMIGFIFVIAGAASWGMGNVVTKQIGKVNGLALVAWGCFVSLPPMIILTLIVDGVPQIIHSMQHTSWLIIGSLAFIAYISTWFGYGVWSWLLTRYTMATVAPFTLLVPVFGMLSSIVAFDEPMQPWKVMATAFIILGLGINVFGFKLFSVYQRINGNLNHD